MSFVKNTNAVGEATDHMHARLLNNQTTNIATNDRVRFDVVLKSFGSNISLDTGTGIFTLKAGKHYRLQGETDVIFTGGGNTYLDIRWYDVTNTAYLQGKDARSQPMSYSNNSCWVGDTVTYVNPSTDIEVELRIVTEVGSSPDALTTRGYAIIEAIR